MGTTPRYPKAGQFLQPTKFFVLSPSWTILIFLFSFSALDAFFFQTWGGDEVRLLWDIFQKVFELSDRIIQEQKNAQQNQAAPGPPDTPHWISVLFRGTYHPVISCVCSKDDEVPLRFVRYH